MRATTYNATKGYEGDEAGRPAGLGRAARVAKNVALFSAAPFIGLAYAVAFPVSVTALYASDTSLLAAMLRCRVVTKATVLTFTDLSDDCT